VVRKSIVTLTHRLDRGRGSSNRLLVGMPFQMISRK